MKRTALLAAFVGLVAPFATGASLQLKLEPRKREVRRGEAAFVRCLVVNPIEEERVWYLKRIFWLVPYSYPMDGDIGLMFDVIGPNGRLPDTKSSMIVARMKTHPLSFVPLRPGEIFGEEFDLRAHGLDYDLSSPGVYRVSAALVPAAPREWLERWLRDGHDARGVPFRRDDLFADTIRAGAVEFSVVE